MSRHNPIIFYRHMLDHAREAVALAQGKTRADLDTDRLWQIITQNLSPLITELEAIVPTKFKNF